MGRSVVLVGRFCYVWRETGRQLFPLYCMLSYSDRTLAPALLYCIVLSICILLLYIPLISCITIRILHMGRILTISENKYVLVCLFVCLYLRFTKQSTSFSPGYRWTSNTPSSTVSISSSAITGNRERPGEIHEAWISQSTENTKTAHPLKCIVSCNNANLLALQPLLAL